MFISLLSYLHKHAVGASSEDFQGDPWICTLVDDIHVPGPHHLSINLASHLFAMEVACTITFYILAEMFGCSKRNSMCSNTTRSHPK